MTPPSTDPEKEAPEMETLRRMAKKAAEYCDEPSAECSPDGDCEWRAAKFALDTIAALREENERLLAQNAGICTCLCHHLPEAEHLKRQDTVDLMTRLTEARRERDEEEAAAVKAEAERLKFAEKVVDLSARLAEAVGLLREAWAELGDVGETLHVAGLECPGWNDDVLRMQPRVQALLARLDAFIGEER